MGGPEYLLNTQYNLCEFLINSDLYALYIYWIAV
jgi:hypothetical protein